MKLKVKLMIEQQNNQLVLSFPTSEIRVLIGRISRLEKALRQIADHDTQLPWVACARIARLALGSDSAEVEE